MCIFNHAIPTKTETECLEVEVIEQERIRSLIYNSNQYAIQSTSWSKPSVCTECGYAECAYSHNPKYNSTLSSLCKKTVFSPP